MARQDRASATRFLTNTGRDANPHPTLEASMDIGSLISLLGGMTASSTYNRSQYEQQRGMLYEQQVAALQGQVAALQGQYGMSMSPSASLFDSVGSAEEFKARAEAMRSVREAQEARNPWKCSSCNELGFVLTCAKCRCKQHAEWGH